MQKIKPDMDIGYNIQKLRRNSGLTQDQTIAKMHLMGLDISKSTYAKIETNRLNIKVSVLMALTVIFDSEISKFFDGLIHDE